VSEAAVVVAEDSRHERRLVAYVVGNNGQVPTPEELRAFLGDHLPDAMIPAVLRTALSLPLTPNGKPDRRALSQAGGDLAPEAGSFVAPRTPVEEQLCTIWAGLLGLDRVSIHDNFFGLGGHSLLATQAVSRIRDTLGIDLPLRRLFETPRVSELAPVVTQALVDAADPDLVENLLDEVTRPGEPPVGGAVSPLPLEAGEGE
jgi:hypothetical protein